MDLSQTQLVTLGLLLAISLLVGFVFGRWTDDSAASNKVMLAVLILLALTETSFTLLDIFPGWSKWWSLLVLLGWFGLSLCGVLTGFNSNPSRKVQG